MIKDVYNYLVEKSISRNPQTNRELCFYNPSQTLNGLLHNKKIIQWHDYILKKYTPKPANILLFFPCAANKPWTEGITKSRNYQILYEILNKIQIKKKVQLHTISEPLGIIGEIDYGKMPVYDNPGLFQWFTKKNKLFWDEESYNKCIFILGTLIGKFLRIHKEKYKKIIGFVKPNSSHEKMLLVAKEASNCNIIIKPSKSEMGTLNNPYTWMANSHIQDILIDCLKIS